MTSPASHSRQSYYQNNATWIENSVFASKPQAFKDLLTSFLTIKRYRDLLFDPGVHLRNDIVPDFISEVMIPDFGIVILKLRDYTGDDRRGILEAYTLMDSALRELYKAHTAKDLVEAAMDCRNTLHAAYQQLEHWDKYL